jgi:hypothetical protein
MRALGWLTRAGLENPSARTFVVDLQAPFSEDRKRALACLIQMRWDDPGSELTGMDLDLFHRLKDRAHPDSIIDSDDYFGFFTYSLFWGTVPPEPTPLPGP